jgi:hypothetical protein
MVLAMLAVELVLNGFAGKFPIIYESGRQAVQTRAIGKSNQNKSDWRYLI